MPPGTLHLGFYLTSIPDVDGQKVFDSKIHGPFDLGPYIMHLIRERLRLPEPYELRWIIRNLNREKDSQGIFIWTD